MAFASVVSSATLVLFTLVVAIWLSSRFVLPQLLSLVVRVTNARGVHIEVGAVGFLHVSDVVVNFNAGPVETICVDDLLYTGHITTLGTWLYEFVTRRVRGGRLRESLPGMRHDARAHGGEETRGGSRRGEKSSTRDEQNETASSRRDSLIRENSVGLAFGANVSPKGAYSGSRNRPEDAKFETPGRSKSGGDGYEPSTFETSTSERKEKENGGDAKKIKLNVPVLCAGVRVKLRKVIAGTESSPTSSLNAHTDPDESPSKKKESPTGPGFACRFATWQLVKGFSQFLEATATDVKVDARDVGGPLFSFNHVAVTSRIRPTAMILSLATDAGRVVGETVGTFGTNTSPVQPPVTRNNGKKRLRVEVGNSDENAADGNGDDLSASVGVLTDGRIECSLRYNLREGRVLLASASVDIGEVDVLDVGDVGTTDAGDDAHDTGDTPSSYQRGESDYDFDSTKHKSKSTITSKLRGLPAMCTLRVGHTRLRTKNSSSNSGEQTVYKKTPDGVAAILDNFSVTAERRAGKNRETQNDTSTRTSTDPTLRVETKWSRFVCGVDDNDETTHARCNVKDDLSVSTSGGTLVTNLPLTSKHSKYSQPTHAKIRIDVAAVVCNAHPRLVDALALFLARLTRGSRRDKNKPSRLKRDKDETEFSFETECRVFDGARFVVFDCGTDTPDVRLLDTTAKVVEFRVNTHDERSEDTECTENKLGLDETSNRGVVVAAEDWRWRVADSCGVSGTRNDKLDSSTRGANLVTPCRAARIEMRQFGESRNITVTSPSVDAHAKTFSSLRGNFRKAAGAVSSSGKKLRRAATGRLNTHTDATRASSNDEKNTPGTPSTATRVECLDGKLRVRADTRPESRGGAVVPASAAAAVCAFEFVAPTVSIEWRRLPDCTTVIGTSPGNPDSKLKNNFQVTTAGLRVTYVDDMGSGVASCEAFFEKDENDDHKTNDRVTLASLRSFSFEATSDSSQKLVSKRSVTADGVHLVWDPDAHFAVLEIGKAVREGRQGGLRTPKATKEKTRARKEKENASVLRLAVSNVTVDATVTDGARLSVTSGSVTTDDVSKQVALQKTAVDVNGFRVATSIATEVLFSSKTVSKETAFPKSFATEKNGARRRVVELTTTSPRFALPHGLDFGDFLVALDVGVMGTMAFMDGNGGNTGTGRTGTENGCGDNKSDTTSETDSSSNETDMSSRTNPVTSPKPVVEVFVRVVNDLECDVHDSALQRCLRVKSAVLEPALASARALTAAGGSGNAISEKKRTRTENEEHKRVFDLFSHAARLASKLSTGARFADDDGSVTRGSADSGTVDDVVRAAVPAGKFSMGHDSSCLLTFGGDLESAASSEVSFAKKTDAPFSNHVTLKTVRAAVVDITVTDFSLQLPLAPGPLFAVRKAQITGPMALARQVPELGGSVVQARQVPPKHGSALVSEKDDATTPTLPSLPIGRRRFVAAKSPTALKKPPVKLYTDLEVSLVRPTGCFAVSAEPALVGLLRELTRLTPPPGLRHKNAPGGGGGRDAHALATAELFRFAVLEKWKNGVSSPPPALPIWDVLRVTWRGKARVLLTDFAYVLDPRCGVSNSLLKRSRGPVGFEVGAKKTEIEITAGSVAVKVARLAFAARGGIGGGVSSGVEDSEFQGNGDPFEATAAGQTGAVDASTPTENQTNYAYDANAVQLAVIPAAEFSVALVWKTLGDGSDCLLIHGGGQDHHRFDAQSASVELRPVSSSFSTGCDVTLDATLTTKDALVTAWRLAEARRVVQSQSASAAKTSPIPSANSTPQGSVALGTFPQSTTPKSNTPGTSASPLARWMSGDFGPGGKTKSGFGGAGLRTCDGAPTDSPKTTTSPKAPTPGMASAVSAAAAAAVADAASTPTLIIGPTAIVWLRGFSADFAKPSGASRAAWKTPVRGVSALYKKPKHPLAKPLPQVISKVVVLVTAESLRMAHPSTGVDDTARGLTAHTSGANGTFTFKRLTTAGDAGTVDTGADGTAAGTTAYTPPDAKETESESSVSFELTLQEIRVLLPPKELAAATPTSSAATPRTPRLETRFGSANSPRNNVTSPTIENRFDEECGAYEAVVEMLAGGGVGGVGGVSRSNNQSGLFGNKRGRNRDTTDPALVLETKLVRFVKQAGVGYATSPGDASSSGDASTYTKIHVESPRFLKATARKDASVRWARDAWRAASSPATPKHSVSSLRAMARKGDANGDESASPFLNSSVSVSLAPARDANTRDAQAFAATMDRVRNRDHRSESWDGGCGVVSKRTPRSAVPLWDGDDLVSLLLGNKGNDAGDGSDGVSAGPAATHRRRYSEMPGPLGNQSGFGALQQVGGTFETGTPAEQPGDSIPEEAEVLGTEETANEDSEPSETETETVLFVVDVTCPQFNFEGRHMEGRVLVAATSGTIVGKAFSRRDAFGGTFGDQRANTTKHNRRREVSISLHKAQAHVAPLDVDLYAGVQWLDEETVLGGSGSVEAGNADNGDRAENANKNASSSSGYLLRRIFEPCSMDLAFITKEVGSAAGSAGEARHTLFADEKANQSEKKGEEKGKGKENKPERPPEALTEFKLKSPEIHASLDSEQFQSLVDVVGSVFLSPLSDTCMVSNATRASLLLANDSRSLVDAEDVASAAVVAAPLAEHRNATWRLVSHEADWETSHVWTGGITNRDGDNDTPDSTPLNGTSVLQGLKHEVLRTEHDVGLAIEKAERLVKQNRRRPAIALELSIERFKWQMRAGGRSFLVAHVEGLRLHRERHGDTSGNTSLRLFDLKLDVPAAKSIIRQSNSDDAGTQRPQKRHAWTKPVFCRWDPDSVDDPDGFGNTIGGFSKAHSFGVGSPKGGEVDGEAEEDLFEEGRKSKKTKSSSSHPPLVLIDATRAASPPEAPVWDLIEVTVAPFDLHLERETYGSFIKYAFPEKKKDGQKMSDEMTANHAAFELGLQALRGRTVPISREKEKDTSDLKLEAVDWTLGLKGDGSGGLTGDDPAAKGGASSDEPAKEKSHSEEQARLLLLGAPLRAKHARAKTWGADFFLNHKRGETETGTGVPTASPKEFSTPTKRRRGVSGGGTVGGGGDARRGTTLGDRAPRPSALSVGDPGAVFGTQADASLGFPKQQQQQLPTTNSPKVVVVKYLRVNEVSLKVSYDGPPRSFHEVRLLLDASTHASFTGRWRELIDRLKGNVVWSVLKSVTGLQGKKLKGSEGGARTGQGRTGQAGATGGQTRGNTRGITVVVDNADHQAGYPGGFETFDGDLDFLEARQRLGSPTAAAMVAESDGLVVPQTSLGKTMWRSVFGGRKTSVWANSHETVVEDTDDTLEKESPKTDESNRSEGALKKTKARPPDPVDQAAEARRVARETLLTSWGKKPK